MLALTRAASSVVIAEPESGTVRSPAIKMTDTTASGDAAVKFGAPAATCSITDKLVNPCRRWLSAFSNFHLSSSSGSLKSEILNHESRIGRQLDFVHQYHPVGSYSLSADEKYFIARANTYLYTTFKPSDNWGDAGGGNATVNARIDSMANSIKSVAPKKVLIGVYHEPEDNVSPGTANCAGLKGSSGSPAQYRAMWANVRQRFNNMGVTNAVWVVNYMGTSKWFCMYKDLWPGNDHVDWVMWDPYNFGSETLGWNTNIGDFYNWMVSNSDATHDYTSKAWGLAEWGVANTSQATAYRWYDEAKTSINDNNYWSRLKLFSVYDTVLDNDLRVDHNSSGGLDSAEQQHYNAFANSPAFKD